MKHGFGLSASFSTGEHEVSSFVTTASRLTIDFIGPLVPLPDMDTEFSTQGTTLSTWMHDASRFAQRGSTVENARSSTAVRFSTWNVESITSVVRVLSAPTDIFPFIARFSTPDARLGPSGEPLEIAYRTEDVWRTDRRPSRAS